MEILLSILAGLGTAFSIFLTVIFFGLWINSRRLATEDIEETMELIPEEEFDPTEVPFTIRVLAKLNIDGDMIEFYDRAKDPDGGYTFSRSEISRYLSRRRFITLRKYTLLVLLAGLLASKVFVVSAVLATIVVQFALKSMTDASIRFHFELEELRADLV